MNMRLSLLLFGAVLFASATIAQPPPPNVIWEANVDAVSVTYSSDGAHVAAAGVIRQGTHTYGRLDVFAAADGEVVAHREGHGTSSIIGRTNRLALSPDGQTIVSGHGGSRCTAMFGCSMERPGLFTWTFPDLVSLQGRTDLTPATSVAFAPNGVRLAAGYFYDGQGLVRVHHAQTLAEVQSHIGHAGRANDVAYSPDGFLLASVGVDGNLRVRDVATGDLLYGVQHGTLTAGGRPVSVAFSPDGSRIVTGGDGYNVRVKVWEAATGELVMDLDGLMEPGGQGAVRVAYSPNGHYLVGAMYQLPAGSGPWQGRIRFWDAQTGEIMEEYADTGPAPYHGGIRSIAFSEAENHRFAYVVGEIGVVKLAETEMNLRDDDGPVVGSEPGASALVLVDVYPNPTSGATWLGLEVPGTEVVRVEVSDVLGRRVALLHDGELTAARRHVLTLDTRSLPSGVYVVRLTGETFSATRRLTVVR